VEIAHRTGREDEHLSVVTRATDGFIDREWQAAQLTPGLCGFELACTAGLLQRRTQRVLAGG
jgi:hypothetical protein